MSNQTTYYFEIIHRKSSSLTIRGFRQKWSAVGLSITGVSLPLNNLIKSVNGLAFAFSELASYLTLVKSLIADFM